MNNVQLLRKVQAHILEEPKRFLMDDWIIREGKVGRATYSDDFGGKVEFPACGTAACIAGWTAILGGRPESWEPWADAAQLLELTPEEEGRLFHKHRWPKEFQARYTLDTDLETRAKIAAERIEHFISTKGAE